MTKDNEELNRAGIAGASAVIAMIPYVKGVIVISVIDGDDEETVTAMTHTKMPHDVVARALLSEAERLITGRAEPTSYRKGAGGEPYRIEK